MIHLTTVKCSKKRYCAQFQTFNSLYLLQNSIKFLAALKVTGVDLVMKKTSAVMIVFIGNMLNPLLQRFSTQGSGSHVGSPGLQTARLKCLEMDQLYQI